MKSFQLKQGGMVSASDIGINLTKLILDGTKIQWHQDRMDMDARGERFAPITIDMALTRACNLACNYCYAQMQENERKSFTKETVTNFIDDCAEVGVKGISLVSDGESTLSPFFVEAIRRGHERGISMASGTNGLLLTKEKLQEIIPRLTYLRFNITAGEKKRYQEIMGSKENGLDKFVEVATNAVRIKKETGSDCTLGFQMVLMPQFEDQIIPLAKLGKEIGVDYLVIKHCSDDEEGFLGVDYSGYERMYSKLLEAEAMSTKTYRVAAKWSKIKADGKRSYQRCYGAPYLLQISGSGLVAPCGMLFGERYKKFHCGNIVTERFKDIVFSDRYWEVMNYLRSEDFNAQKMCGSLCLQHKVNEHLDNMKNGRQAPPVDADSAPEHVNFI